MTDIDRVAIIEISKIKLDNRIQPRDSLNEDALSDYAAIYKEKGASHPFPPMRVYKIDGEFILTRGFHRIEAATRAGLKDHSCEVVLNGTIDEALLDSISDNRKHGVRYTNRDKWRIVMMLEDRYRDKNNAEIAKLAMVSPEFVRKVRHKLYEPKPEAAIVTFSEDIDKDEVSGEDGIFDQHINIPPDDLDVGDPFDAKPLNVKPKPYDPSEKERAITTARMRAAKTVEAAMRAVDELNDTCTRLTLCRSALAALRQVLHIVREWK